MADDDQVATGSALSNDGEDVVSRRINGALLWGDRGGLAVPAQIHQECTRIATAEIIGLVIIGFRG